MCSIAEDKTAIWDQTAEILFATSPVSFSSSDPSQTGGTNVVAPAGDQGTCFSCVAFAVIAAAQSAVARALKTDVSGVQLSVQDLFFCSNDDPGSCEKPWTFPSALKQLKKRSLLQSNCMPYSPPQQPGLVFQRQLCEATCHSINALASQGQFDIAPVNDAWEAVGHILTYGGVLSKFYIYDDLKPFFNDTENIEKVYLPGRGAKRLETHAIYVVGYDMEKGYWLAQNSWSTAWGNHPRHGAIKVFSR